MAKQAALLQSFNAGEWSPLMAGRVDLDKYRASCVKMLNFMATPQGAAVARNGTAFVVPAVSNNTTSALLPFQFSTIQSCVLEFGVGVLRFITEEGLVTTGAASVTAISKSTSYGTPTVTETTQVTSSSATGADSTTTTSKTTDASTAAARVTITTITTVVVSSTGTVTTVQTTTQTIPIIVRLALTVSGGAFQPAQIISVTGLPISVSATALQTTVTAVQGNVLVTDTIWPLTAQEGPVNAAIGTAYEIQTPYLDATKLSAIRYAQKNDVLYLFCDGYPVYKLSRYAATNWTMQQVDFIDGPYLDVNYANNRAMPASSGGALVTNLVWTPNSSNNQQGVATWSYGSAIALTGYQITIPGDDDVTVNSTIYSAKDRAPSSWVLEGSNDSNNWTIVDTQTLFVDYANNCTDWIPLYGNVYFQFYRLRVTQTYIQQGVSPTISAIVCTSNSDAPFIVNFDNTQNINFGSGFSSSDTGRLLRLQRSDGTWIAVKIVAVNSQTQVACACITAPLLDLTPTTWWRAGLFCVTNGYPTCGVFYAERLWMAGCQNYPDTVVASEVGSYETMQPNDPRTYAVTDADAINVTLESRSQVLWMNTDDRGIVMGTAAGEWTIQSGGYTNYTTASDITPTSLLARSPTQRGSADVDAVRVDHQVLHVQRSGRQARAMAYSFEIDGYSSTSLSTQASHLGQPSIVRMAYQAEPYSTVWFVRSDGILLALTYMVDQQVTGWSQHDIGGVVESCTVIPSPDSQQDTLWLLVRRTINGQTVRYVERMLRLWDFDMTNLDAAFMDCCTINTGKTQNVGGLYHLAGEQVYALIDGVTPEGPLQVGADGTVLLSVTPQAQVVIGLGMSAELVTQRLEAGAQNGTAQGKTKRTDQVVCDLWATGSGSVGLPPDVNRPQGVSTPIQFDMFHGTTGTGPLYSFQYKFVMPPGYDRRGSLTFTRSPADLFPLNIVSVTAFVDTQDAE